MMTLTQIIADLAGETCEARIDHRSEEWVFRVGAYELGVSRYRLREFGSSTYDDEETSDRFKRLANPLERVAVLNQPGRLR